MKIDRNFILPSTSDAHLGFEGKLRRILKKRGKKIFERFMKRDPSYYNSSMLHLPMLNCAMTRNDDKKTSIPFM